MRIMAGEEKSKDEARKKGYQKPEKITQVKSINMTGDEKEKKRGKAKYATRTCEQPWQ